MRVDIQNSIKVPPLETLYHLSTNFPKNDGVVTRWNPLTPPWASTEDIKYKSAFDITTEPSNERICFSTDIDKCIRAIWGNYEHLFDNSPDGTLQFAVFTPVGDIKAVSPITITKNKWVHDAFLTDEWWVLDPVVMKHLGYVKVYDTRDSGYIPYRMFNDSALPVEGRLRPKEVKWVWSRR